VCVCYICTFCTRVTSLAHSICHACITLASAPAHAHGVCHGYVRCTHFEMSGSYNQCKQPKASACLKYNIGACVDPPLCSVRQGRCVTSIQRETWCDAWCLNAISYTHTSQGYAHTHLHTCRLGFAHDSQKHTHTHITHTHTFVLNTPLTPPCSRHWLCTSAALQMWCVSVCT
jgi:hypothetical protein